MGYVDQAPRHEDWGLSRAVGWKLKFCWFPKTCFLTGKKLWGKHAYHGTHLIMGPGEPIYNHYCVEKNEFIIARLKGHI